MKFEPRYVEQNVNVEHKDNFREFIKLSAWLLGIVLGIYLVLGYVAEKIVQRLPYKYEAAIADLFVSKFGQDRYPRTDAYLEQVLDRLVNSAPDLPEFRYTIHIHESELVNAYALPAGHIVVFTGLLKQINSENELAMILSHELGHYVHRDHLRGLGRGLVLVSITAALGISGNSLNYVGSLIQTYDLKFSREQEARADLYALHLIARVYGHAGGALEVLNVLQQQHQGELKGIEILSTHPDSVRRMQALLSEIERMHYPQRSNTPFAHDQRLPFLDDDKREAQVNEVSTKADGAATTGK